MAILIPSTLNAAFNNAHYTVFAPMADITLQIGQYSSSLAGLMAQYHTHTLAILTAYNPQGIAAHPEANLHAQQFLLGSVHKLGLPCLNGSNSAPDGCSHAEPTLAVLGIRREQAYALAQQFRQLAFMYVDSSAVPELVLV